MLCTGVSSHVDDEYKWAGVEDPKVMVTTSRDPSSRLKMFAKVSDRAAKLFLLKHCVKKKKKVKKPQADILLRQNCVLKAGERQQTCSCV